MTRLQRQVLEFHRAFDHPVADSPTIPADDRVRFRAAFIVEECLEFLEACFNGEGYVTIEDPLEGNKITSARLALEEARRALRGVVQSDVRVDLPLAVDALADIDYVVEGTRLEFGVNGEPIADEVHRANMAKETKCSACAGQGWRQKNDTDSETCPFCGGKGLLVVKREDGKMLKPEGWTPPDIAGCLAKQRASAYLHLKTAAMALPVPPETAQQKAEQRLCWAYGNLAIDGKASRSAFKMLAMAPLHGEVVDGCAWTEEQFDEWAKDKEWSDDGK